MKLSIQGIRDDEGVRSIINALLELDLGARINFESHMVCVAGRMTIGDASAAIERCGFAVVSVVDRTVVDAGFRPTRAGVAALSLS